MSSSSIDSLWERWRSGEDAQAGEELTARYMGLVYHAVREVLPRVRGSVTSDELVSAGSLGLLQAMRGFDLERGLAFSTFAMRRIRGAILDELRARDPLTRTERVLARRLEAAASACEQALGRVPTANDLADYLGVAVETVLHWQARSQIPADSSLDDSGAGARQLAERIGDGSLDQLSHLELEERSELISAALAALPQREALILTRSYLEGFLLSQIAAELGLTESRVCQLRSQALQRLRTSPVLELAIE